MQPRPYRNEAGQDRLLFVLWLWLSICIALLSALAPLGPPSSRFTGSAFNPATISVVVKARTAAQPVITRATEPDGKGRAALPVPSALWLSSMVMLAVGIWRLRPFHRFSTLFPFLHAPVRLSRRHARAPPALS